MTAIASYEAQLCRALLDGLASIRGLRLYGVAAPAELAWRVPTFGFTLAGIDNLEAARRLGERGIFVWAGHHYALTLMERLGLGEAGVIRVGAVHYNSGEDVERLLGALDGLSR
jgi:selenocysteine lyase/cysteine desulfurase